MKIVNLIEDTKGSNDCTFEHGLSFYIETKNHKILVDTGASDAFLENAKKLSIDLTKVDTVIISHGHYDHAGGLLSFCKINKTAKIYMQKGASKYFCRRIEDGSLKYIGIDKDILSLDNLILIDGDYKIDDELFLFSNVTGRKLWPKGNLILKYKENEELIQDDFSHEQSLVVTQNDKKYLFSGCAHNGIINIIDKYKSIFGKEPNVVISGFHMMKKTAYEKEDVKIVEETANILKQYNTIYYTGHCTGLPALEIMKPILKDKLVALHSGNIIE